MSQPLSRSPAASRWRRVSGRRVASLAIAVLVVGPFASRAAAQTNPTTTSTTAPGFTTTTTTVAGLAPTTTTTLPAAIASVPAPPPPPPPPAGATPAEVAQADRLEQEIESQSDALDELAGTYESDEQKVAATQAQLAQVQGELAVAQTAAATAQLNASRADQALVDVAIDAYVNMGAGAPTGQESLVQSYEDADASVDTQTAMGRALSQLQQLRFDEQSLQAAENTALSEEQRASQANATAVAAANQAQVAAASGTTQQEQLLTTVSQVNGNLAPLVAAAQAAEADSAYQRFSTSGGLQFTPAAPLPAVLPQAAPVIQLAEQQVGKPYLWGADGPNAFDCSGLTQWTWDQFGVALPRVAANQQSWAIPVPISQLEPGDLVFFGSPAHHVGLYLGDGLMVDAPHTGTNVTVESIWWPDLTGFGRVH